MPGDCPVDAAFLQVSLREKQVLALAVHETGVCSEADFLRTIKKVREASCSYAQHGSVRRRQWHSGILLPSLKMAI